jgi:YVTN family beta-propeller protein
MHIRISALMMCVVASGMVAAVHGCAEGEPHNDVPAGAGGGPTSGGTAGTGGAGAGATTSSGGAGGGAGSGGATSGGNAGGPAGTGGTRDAGSSGGSGGKGGGAAGTGGTPDAGRGDASSGGSAGQADSGRDGSGGTAGADAGDATVPPVMRDVLLVGNSLAGTVSFLDPNTFENLGSINVLPDRDEVMAAINADLVRFIAYPIVKNAQLLHHFEPGGGDRFVDDLFVSPDGTVLYVSRSNLGDVAAFDLTKSAHPRLWRTFVESPKADHAAISPDGSRLVVSATGTSRLADILDARTGKIVGSFATGAYPHQNDYSADGKYIYNSSIGNVGYQAVTYANNVNAGDRWLVKVDAATLQVQKTWVFEWGIRPSVITADDAIMYAQLSYLNGVIKYDLAASKEVKRSDQPLSAFALATYKTYDEYPHHSAHHGLAISKDGKRLCDCGTIDNTVSIVRTDDMTLEKTIDVGMVPYWATTSPDGLHCFVSLSGSDAISVIDYNAGTEVKVVPVGKFPQRSRLGRVPEHLIALLSRTPG